MAPSTSVDRHTHHYPSDTLHALAAGYVLNPSGQGYGNRLSEIPKAGTPAENQRMTFNELNLISPLVRAVTEAGYTHPTEIQSGAIPHILKGSDIIGCARTGTGKTAAFAIPVLQRLSELKPSSGIKTLVLTPTRELALQIDENFRIYGKYLQTSILSIFGGVPQHNQVKRLRQGVDVLIATPGRLNDLMAQGFIDLGKIEILVLDEADQMLDMGFVNDVKKIVKRIPASRQTLFFSATMPKSIRELANTLLKNPKEITVTPVSSAATTVSQSVYFVDKQQKTDLLLHLLTDATILRSLVFTRTKHGADKLVKQLSKTGIFAAAIHGNKTQNARKRALDDFRNSKIRVLVATDIAARGIDIDELPHVVNYELPNVPETYVHRIGRTGRAGMSGTAVSFCDREERGELKDIQKLIGFDMPVLRQVAGR